MRRGAWDKRPPGLAFAGLTPKNSSDCGEGRVASPRRALPEGRARASALNVDGGTTSVSSGEAPAAQALSSGFRRRQPGQPVEIDRGRLEFGLVVVSRQTAEIQRGPDSRAGLRHGVKRRPYGRFFREKCRDPVVDWHVLCSLSHNQSCRIEYRGHSPQRARCLGVFTGPFFFAGLSGGRSAFGHDLRRAAGPPLQPVAQRKTTLRSPGRNRSPKQIRLPKSDGLLDRSACGGFS